MGDFDLELVWFRRDLCVADHAALYHALTRCRRVLCAFVFDSEILSPCPQNDRRVPLIHASLIELDKTLSRHSHAPLDHRGQRRHRRPAL